MNDQLAARIANRPDAYGARYRNLDDAINAKYRMQGAIYRIIMGHDGTFWVMPNRNAVALIRSGYEEYRP